MQKKNILFALKCIKPSGGALKVRHYYEHALRHKDVTPLLYMPDDIVWKESNPWYQYKDCILPEVNWDEVDLVFISGWGWERFIPTQYHYKSHFKVIYLVQHPSKLMSNYDRYQDLDKPATRICVSEALRKMAEKIPQINGDVVTIPAGTNLSELIEIAKRPKTIDVLISGLKNPSLGSVLAKRLSSTGLKVKLLDKRMARNSYIDYVSVSKIVVCLPNPLEGFYLPAIEAMALGARVVCPDAIGNDYCEDGINCLVPPYTENGVFEATISALNMSHETITFMKKHIEDTVNAHDIKQEEKSFHQILDKLTHS